MYSPFIYDSSAKSIRLISFLGRLHVQIDSVHIFCICFAHANAFVQYVRPEQTNYPGYHAFLGIGLFSAITGGFNLGFVRSCPTSV